MACPTVAGVVATLLQRFPRYTPQQIKEQLIYESTKNAVNLKTFQGNNLPSVIASTTPNKFAYTGRCGNSKCMYVTMVQPRVELDEQVSIKFRVLKVHNELADGIYDKYFM